MEGTILIEAMDLSRVMGFEEINEVVEEIMDLDHRLIRDRRQADFYRTGIGTHVHPRDATRRGAAISGWAKTSR